MNRRLFHPVATAIGAAVAFIAAASPISAQQRPTAQQAQALLQAQPDLVNQLRQRLMTSGLSPQEIRAKLRAEGYPEGMLDAYLSSGGGGTTEAPSEDVLAAVRALGIVQEPDLGVPSAPAKANQPAAGGVFGLSIFRSVTSEFLPNLDGPVDAGYRVGPGDRLVLILTGDVELAHTLDITREGFVVIPQVGQLSVANLTLAQLESLLYARLGRVYSGVKRGPGATTRFSVSVARLRSNQIFVVGDVERPGSYRVSSAGTALTALYAAGGPSDRGSLRRISVRRGGKTVSTLDVYDYLLRGDASADVRLENGDVVFVPVRGAMVTVAGEITRSGTYEMKDGETLADLIAAAGGFSPGAGRQHLQIERIIPPAQRRGAGRDRVLLEVSSAELAGGGVPSLRVEPGDVVRVFSISAKLRDRIVVAGNVWLSGPQGFTEGLTLSQALRRAGGAKPDTYLGQVLVSRLESDSTRTQLRAVLRDTSGAVLGDDIRLREEDQIQVFSRTEFRPARYVSIAGAVRKPGQYQYREGITMRDLVLLAGGVEERADLQTAEIARLPESRAGGVTARTIRAPLDSSYLFERGADGKYIGPPGIPAAAGPAPEVTLEPYDNVLILPQPDWRLLRTVTISGEVKYPGRYTISNKSERVSDLVRRAGGLSAEANADGAYFARRRASTSYLSPADSSAPRRIGAMATDSATARRTDALAADSTTARRTSAPAVDSATARRSRPLATDSAIARRSVAPEADSAAVRVGMDLRGVLREPLSSDDLLLQDGDSLDVPSQRGTVEIRGAVNAPTVVPLVPGQKLEHYVRAAGGPNRVAAPKEAYVLQPNGKFESRRRVLLVFRSDPTPRAGATVFVPMRDTTIAKDQTLQSAATIMTILSTLVTTFYLIRRI